MSDNVCDTLITDIGFVLTIDDERTVRPDAAIAIRDRRVIWVGPNSESVDFEPKTRVSGRDRIAIPGMVDCHLHSSFALSRGLADECGAQEFLIERMYRYEAGLSNEDVYLAARLAISELLLHGVTCFVDPGNRFPEATRQAAEELGIRASIARSNFDVGSSSFGSVPSNLVATADASLVRAREDLEGFGPNELVWPSLSFRGVNNASDELIQGLHALSSEFQVQLQTHAAFSYSTRDASWQRFGKAEVERLYDLGVLGPSTFLIHGGWLSPREVMLVIDTGAALVLSPSSSLHNSYGNILRGRHAEILAAGGRVALGSDHASSGAVDMIREAFLFCGLSKEISLDPKSVPPELALEMATRYGADVAGRPDLGSIRVGGPADIVLVRTDVPAMQPLYNPVSNLIYGGCGALVTDVWVAGRRVVADRTLTTTDLDILLEEVRGFAAHGLAERDFEGLIRSGWSW